MSRVATRRLAYVLVGFVAVVARWIFVDLESIDYVAFLSGWWAYIDQHGHLAALRDAGFSNYNTPYLVLLAVATYFPVRAIVAIKTISIVFDILLAVVASRLVAAVRPGSTRLPLVTFAVVCFLPTAMMDSGVWGQCDSIYATFCALSLLALVRGRPWAASAWFGVAFAFKLQALFLLPVLVGVLLVNRLKKRSLLAAPATFLACLVPAMIAGRSLISQISVYPSQVGNPSGVGQATAAQNSTLTHNAPTPYAWLPSSTVLLYAGLALVTLVVLGFGVWLLLRKRTLSPGEVVLVAATAALLIPLLLPHMHERYFYLAEVLLVVACAVDRRFVVAVVAMQVANTSTYLTFLAGIQLMPLAVAAVFAVAAGAAATWSLVSDLRVSSQQEAVS